MKKILGLLAAALFVGSVVSAQTPTPIDTATSFSLPSQDEVIGALFYNDDPFAGGELVDGQYRIGVSDSSIGQSINADEDISYAVLVVEDTDLVFSTPGITSTATPSLTVNNDEQLSIRDVARALYTANGDDKQLAIFIDEDGLVSGFYEHYAGVELEVHVPDAEYLILASADTSYVYEVADSGATQLSNVGVDVDGEAATLGSLDVLN